jgi:hypothetical protein
MNARGRQHDVFKTLDMINSDQKTPYCIRWQISKPFSIEAKKIAAAIEWGANFGA